MTRKTIIIILLLLIGSGAIAQEEDLHVVFGKVVDGDTIPFVPLREVTIYSWRILDDKRAERRLSRLMKNVKKVYPYAKLAGIKLKEYEDILLAAETDKERRRIMKQAEDEIEQQYGQELRDLTFSQGKILIKLIYRETANTSYDLVADLRGKFIAAFYQAFARIFGYNLKEKYDPEGADRDIEIIVRMIENGQL